ncbi:hypothetical protein BDV98DRAFT_569902 [Pterulicium gracile]|uniref:Uncharacterized protein n=1 Tax=Pterulicium gracile TaxID=1884261 RepID=A0A5C3QHS1_9AGAR|nr:hypothetical protein BDV98DRAFT_569902 [Pterula gracilis]
MVDHTALVNSRRYAPYIVNSVMAYLTVKFILWKARSFAADSADILAVFKYVVEDAVQGF